MGSSEYIRSIRKAGAGVESPVSNDSLVDPFHLPCQNLHCSLAPQAEHEPMVEVFAILYGIRPSVPLNRMGGHPFRLVSATARILGTHD
jgi:hypothetical protein